MFVALVIRHAKRMRRVILLPVSCPTLTHFFTSSYKGMILEEEKEEKIIGRKMCFFSLSTSFV